MTVAVEVAATITTLPTAHSFVEVDLEIIIAVLRSNNGVKVTSGMNLLAVEEEDHHLLLDNDQVSSWPRAPSRLKATREAKAIYLEEPSHVMNKLGRNVVNLLPHEIMKALVLVVVRIVAILEVATVVAVEENVEAEEATDGVVGPATVVEVGDLHSRTITIIRNVKKSPSPLLLLLLLLLQLLWKVWHLSCQQRRMLSSRLINLLKRKLSTSLLPWTFPIRTKGGDRWWKSTCE